MNPLMSRVNEMIHKKMEPFSSQGRFIQMWIKKDDSRWRNHKYFLKEKDKDHSPMICYECKKPKPFMFECPELEKTKEKKNKPFFMKKKKGLMSTWEDMATMSSKEEGDEEANVC